MKRLASIVLVILSLSSAAQATPLSEWIYVPFSGIVDDPGGYFPSSGYPVTGYALYDPVGGPYNYQYNIVTDEIYWVGFLWPSFSSGSGPCCYKSFSVGPSGFAMNFESVHDLIHVAVNFAGTGFFDVSDETGWLQPAHGTITSVPEVHSLLLLVVGLPVLALLACRMPKRLAS